MLWKRLREWPFSVRIFNSPDQLYGAIYRSPFPHARILKVDVSQALSLQGVRAVVTSGDHPYMHGPVIEDEPFLAHKKVRYAGEPIAVIAAEDQDIARQAVSLIRADFDELPPVLDPAARNGAGDPSGP